MIPRILETVDPEFRLAFALCILFSNSRNGDIQKSRVNLPKRMYREFKTADMVRIAGNNVFVLPYYRKQISPEILIELLGFVCKRSNVDAIAKWQEEHKVEKDALQLQLNKSFNVFHRT